MIQPGESCRIINEEKELKVLTQDGIDYPLKPGVDTIVPAELVINWFGDPRSTNHIQHIKTLRGEDGWILDRPTEVRRLRVKWGNGDAAAEDTITAMKVSVYTVLGERVTLVTEDPQGATVNPATMTESQQSNIFGIMEKMQRELDELRRRAGEKDSEDQLIHEDELPTDDAPDNVNQPHTVTPQPAYDDPGEEDDGGLGATVSR